MANICYNQFYISFDKENYDEVVKRISNLFNKELNGEITGIDSEYIEGYFDSRWVFPMHIFENIFDGLENIYMRCLSEEYGCDYVAMNIYTDNKWKYEQTFDLY